MQYKTKTQTLVAAAVLAALLAVIAPVTIPVGPIPFSLALFGVYLLGAMLPPLAASASLGVYVLLGMVGLPVFSGYRGGPQVLVGATGGYIVGYFAIALAISLAVKHGAKLPVQIAAGLAGTAVCYAIGTLWYMLVMKTSFLSGLMVCVAPFAIPDIIKEVLALGLAQLLHGRLVAKRAQP